MKRLLIAASAFTLLAGVSAAGAQPHRDYDRQQQQDHHDNNRSGQNNGYRHNNGYRQHNDWKKGRRMSSNDWSRGQRVDYRSRHLQRPPRGYEWREVDGNLIMGAVATGLIFSIIANQ